jgi:hypothetical protein
MILQDVSGACLGLGNRHAKVKIEYMGLWWNHSAGSPQVRKNMHDKEANQFPGTIAFDDR